MVGEWIVFGISFIMIVSVILIYILLMMLDGIKLMNVYGGFKNRVFVVNGVVNIWKRKKNKSIK